MKKTIFTLFAILNYLAVFAQDSIPNGSFEYWNSATYDYPRNYPQNSNSESFFRCQTPFNVVRSTDSYSGTYALELSTQASTIDTCGGYILNATNANGNPSTWEGGIPFNQQPTGIRGYYKYNVASADSALIILIFKNSGIPIGVYTYTIGGIHSSYTLFDFTFSPALPIAADTVIFATAASNLLDNNGIPGSILKLDSISFKGVVSQPANMNGDFELWDSQPLETPNNWYAQSDGNGSGIAKSYDPSIGSFAIELVTFAGDNNGTPEARPAMVSTGYWDMNCSCAAGGSPFSNQVDTLVFSYKYAPTIASDSAYIYMTFKSNGAYIWYAGLQLPAAASYTTIEIPFNTNQAPDTIIINMQSSLWSNTAIGYIDAVLKVDNMHFKTLSGPTGVIENKAGGEVRFYPNPIVNSGVLELGSTMKTDGLELTIYDVVGKAVRKIAVDQHQISIQKNDLQNGIYFYQLTRNQEILNAGKIVIE